MQFVYSFVLVLFYMSHEESSCETHGCPAIPSAMQNSLLSSGFHQSLAGCPKAGCVVAELQTLYYVVFWEPMLLHEKQVSSV